MELFGYPTAHENDAERAARAALAIQRAIGELNRTDVDKAKPMLFLTVTWGVSNVRP
jgi:PleD family two-component response regulator